MVVAGIIFNAIMAAAIVVVARRQGGTTEPELDAEDGLQW